MKRDLLTSVILLVVTAFCALAQSPAEKLDAVVKGRSKGILVAAHRGDWRNAPENSLQALKNCIEKKFDLMELDVKMSKDSQMVIMHDNTIDRTTNGKGKVGDYTLEELSKFRLKNGLGRLTPHPIPTLREMMLAAKGRILINVDKGNDHLDLVFKVLKETATTDQAIVNVGDNMLYEKLIAENTLPRDAYLMVVVNMKNNNVDEIISSYTVHHKTIIQPIFDTDTLSSLKLLKVNKQKSLLWLNSLWPSLNGGHDDDRAVEMGQKEESWGWLIGFNPVILQTDRPVELTGYLKKRKLHQ